MGEVINFPQPGCARSPPAADERLSCDDVVRLEASATMSGALLTWWPESGVIQRPSLWGPRVLA
ncbi:MAG: hypothetical protein CM15mP115_12030 [Alphaproteobacteria bacterium]|nr:MAG: hypothetical protein CM15mP115_12030 [Alphaproteobacteria bacterium]